MKVLEQWMTLEQASKDVGLSPVTLRAYVNGQLKPALPAERIGGRWVVERQMFKAWMATREKKLKAKSAAEE